MKDPGFSLTFCMKETSRNYQNVILLRATGHALSNANNKCMHSHSLISTFVVIFQVMQRLASPKISGKRPLRFTRLRYRCDTNVASLNYSCLYCKCYLVSSPVSYRGPRYEKSGVFFNFLSEENDRQHSTRGDQKVASRT